MGERDTRTVMLDNISLNVLRDNPLVYKSRPLLSVEGKIRVEGREFVTSRILLDCGATTVYVSRTWIEQPKLPTAKYEGQQIRIKLGDNQIAQTGLEVLRLSVQVEALRQRTTVSLLSTRFPRSLIVSSVSRSSRMPSR